ncbi:MAG TPA: hypothetical protein PKK00_09980 [Bacteroidales bacterium]|nr:hypothetical protein [Bacteroidales bacterium]HPS17651.1 hypothetical protein [Bacteroidales bacterium]
MEGVVQFKIYNISDFRTILNDYRKRKIIYNNFYDYSENSEIEAYCGDNTILIRKPDNDFYRCYITSSDHQETVRVLKKLRFEHAINIPSKSSIDNWNKILDESGYTCIGIYERMYYKDVKKRTSRSTQFAERSHLNDIYNSLYSTFNKIVDHLPTIGDIKKMIDNQQIVISQNNSVQKGFLIFTIKDKKCYLNAWLDKSGEGLLLLLDIFNIMILRGINYAYFWVNSENTEVKKIHHLLGARFDGLKDYTFIKTKQHEE